MISVSVKNSIKFPELKLQNDLRIIARDIVIKIMVQNILQQKSLDEGTLLPNSPKYTAQKKKKGLSDKVLIATRKLIRSFIYEDKGKSAVIITLNSDRKDIGGYLQNDMGKNFFGVSTRMERSAMNYMNKKIKEKLNA